MSTAYTLPSSKLIAQYTGTGKPADPDRDFSRGGEPGKYLADSRLVSAVRASLALERPLLVTGEPGTGKTSLAWSVASELGLDPPLEFHTRSDHRATDVLYTFDHVRRFYHAQVKNEAAEDPRNYLTYEALGRALIESDVDNPDARELRVKWRKETEPPGAPADDGLRRRVVLIDEIDKAPRDFPNDLLDEIDRMEFQVKDTGQRFKASLRPIVIITSNSERQLPDPFLRRCVFHWIDFPEDTRLEEILLQRVQPAPSPQLVKAALTRFKELRHKGDQGELEKMSATDELIAWVRVLLLCGVNPKEVEKAPSLWELPYVSTLVKSRGDLKTLRSAQ